VAVGLSASKLSWLLGSIFFGVAFVFLFSLSAAFSFHLELKPALVGFRARCGFGLNLAWAL
jgi:hypothetical protein